MRLLEEGVTVLNQGEVLDRSWCTAGQDFLAFLATSKTSSFLSKEEETSRESTGPSGAVARERQVL
mgnify:CR=1 FL=1